MIIGNDSSPGTAGQLVKVIGNEFNVVGANITGNNDSYNVNIFKVNGNVRVLDQYAIIRTVTALTNMTDVYADLWDGTLSVKLTAGAPGGAVLSGAPVGSLFTKDEDSTNAYTVSLADQGRLSEPNNRDVGRPFIVTQKNGVDTFIRFNYTTNAVLDFTMDIFFSYLGLDGGYLELA